ncbi:hypothetical protein D9757_003145 [Collybiopsis confluens]|uniref:Uncharacterized protein n=1 Tax=Collybiopsis confluens TaxID=2823264 RepID=A0A8H5HXK0_9AGAR|nr:hypothetical protein D9757_003145 [Collybiopsis confluens]
MSNADARAPLDNTMGALVIGILYVCPVHDRSSSLAADFPIFLSLSPIEYQHASGGSPVFKLTASSRPSIIKTHSGSNFWYKVAFVFILDTLHQIMLSHLLYVYFVKSFGDKEHLGTVVWSILVMVFLSAVIALVVQFFLCWRIWILSNKNLFWIVPIILVIIASFAITMAYFIKSWSLRTWVKLAKLSASTTYFDNRDVAANRKYSSLQKISRAVNCLNFGADLAVTFALDRCVDESPDVFLSQDWIIVDASFLCDSLLGIVYTNSFLATLNAREKLRESNRPPGTSFLSDSGLVWARGTETRTEETVMLPSSDGSEVKQQIETQVDRHLNPEVEMESIIKFKSTSSFCHSGTLPV